MSIIGKIAKLDSAMQRGLDNGFAYIFGGRVVPAEIEELLKQEAEDNLVHTYEGTVEVPNIYEVSVSEKDFDLISAEHPTLADDFTDRLSRYFRNNSWISPAPIVIRISADQSLRTGQLHATSDFDLEVSPPKKESAPMNPPAPLPSAPTGKMISLTVDGTPSYQLRTGSTMIGRGTDVDYRLHDTGVSRHHAEIVWDGHEAYIVDLQSTNGTTVNGTPIDNWLLADGDVITIGHSQIVVRIK
ncbi:DUF3662 and FHA domain-containing protein [Corynebacterium sp. ES2794-CONJ1]|uniref:DUF3662 and FHA domain-containing protein n=1 Tax=unclassified Corynebacterium TaxID=2624378 RepID=UPI00216A3E19|nr:MULTISPECIES: DUF3662 and FHA domain-containing protein [unclassified Corynebacterium]MCS4492198.1 DUF3662 and FHA domain-containing protein [Corynebacterium sp. ES2715-CONJ3]MCU9519717.1 DUF3662 and FHA domain-containing protein [Corynebacterium sp. ES2794-CONJ1]